MSKKKEYEVLRPTLAHISVCHAFSIQPLPVMVRRKGELHFGTMSIERYVQFVFKGELP